MKHTPVQSSNITSVAHDPESNTLEVTFKNGGTYSYAGVSAAAHAELLAADSIGAHLHEHIRPKHKASKVG